MAEATHDTKHETEGVARLTSEYRPQLQTRNPDVYNRPVTGGILRSYLRAIQKLEDNAWSVIQGRMLDNATGIRADVIGRIVGELRNGQTDDDFKQIIRLRIRANRTQGKATDLIDLALLAAPAGVVPEYREFWPGSPASWEVTISPGLVNPAAVARILQYAKAAGTYGRLVFSADADPDFTLDDSVSPYLGAEAEWGDSLTAGTGAKWGASL